jgi:hypothetical protein
MGDATWSRAASAAARSCYYALLLSTMILAGCASDSVNGDDDDDDDDDDDVVDIDGGQPPGPDAPPGASRCNMAGVWVAEQYTVSVALGADQTAVNYYYFDISQDGDTFIINKQLNCGFIVTGSANVTVPNATLEALADNEFAGLGRKGTFAEEGDACHFSLQRSYSVRGANKAEFLTDVWNIGDDPIDLDDFPALPANEAQGMEDWDNDGREAITLEVSGLLSGKRAVAQRDWTEHEGTVPALVDQFGGEGVIVVHWDSQEAVSTVDTDFGLGTTAIPSGDGWARYARVGSQLTVVEGNPLQTCLNVQSLLNSPGFWHL